MSISTQLRLFYIGRRLVLNLLTASFNVALSVSLVFFIFPIALDINHFLATLILTIATVLGLIATKQFLHLSFKLALYAFKGTRAFDKNYRLNLHYRDLHFYRRLYANH